MASAAPSSDFLKGLLCPICLDYCAPLKSVNLSEPKEDIVVLGCGCSAIFHRECISSTVALRSCPNCRMSRTRTNITKVGATVLDLIALQPVHACKYCKAHADAQSERVDPPLYTRADVLAHMTECPHAPRQCPHCVKAKKFYNDIRLVKYTTEADYNSHVFQCPYEPDRMLELCKSNVSNLRKCINTARALKGLPPLSKRALLDQSEDDSEDLDSTQDLPPSYLAML